MARFDLLGKFGDVPANSPPQDGKWFARRLRLSEHGPVPVTEKDPSVVVCSSLGGLLLNADLKAVKHMPARRYCYEKLENQYLTPDENHMLTLGEFFNHVWGGMASGFEYAIR